MIEASAFYYKSKTEVRKKVGTHLTIIWNNNIDWRKERNKDKKKERKKVRKDLGIHLIDSKIKIEGKRKKVSQNEDNWFLKVR